MPQCMDDNLGFRYLVEDEIGIRQRHQSANCWIFSASADVRVVMQKFNHGLYACLDAIGALWRMGGNVIEN